MDPPDGHARKRRKGTPAPPARKRRKRTAAAAAPLSVAPPLSLLMCPGDGDATNARRRSKPTGAATPPYLAPRPSVRMARGDGGAPTERRRRMPTGAAAPPSLGPPPSVRGDGGAPKARRRRKPTGAAAPPSLAPLPSVRSDGGAPPAPPSFAPSPSVRMGPANGGAPTARRRRRKPTGTAAAPSRAPLPSVRMARGDGDAPPARKRKGSSRPREGKRGRRANSEGCSSRNGSMGGHGGTERLHDDGAESSAVEEDSREVLAGSDDPNDSGAGVAANPEHGSPEDPTPPSAPHQNVVAGGIISVAHTPNTPPRFEALVRHITSISTYATKGKSYECGLDQMNKFLNWSKSERAFFFEWSDDNMEMIWWMHNLQKGQFFKFTVNAAFSLNMDDINVERAAVAFSRGFIGDNDEYWSGVKDMLLNMFGSFEDEDYDYLYVFTRVGDSIYFRNYKIISFPKADDASSGLVLTEINTSFCIKLIIDQTTPKSPVIGQHHTKNETSTKLNFCPKLNYCPVTLYSSNGQTGCCVSHGVDFSGETYSIMLENSPCCVSSVENLEGFNRSLAEIVVKEPLLKIKHIIGSVTNKTCCFARQRCKSILQSLFAEFAMLFESGKCISGDISMHNVLVRASAVKLYGLDVTDYKEELAKANVGLLVKMVRNCFPDHEIPMDLSELLDDLEKDPLNEIRTAKDDCSLLKAEKRRSLLINIYSEYITSMEAKSSGSDQTNDESKKIDEYTFFDGCPDAGDWELIMKDNEYMVQICDVEVSSDDDAAPGADNQKLNDSVKKRMKKKQRMSKSIKRMAKKRKQEPNEGKLQFSAIRDFEVRMPEMASKDGVLPFRLGIADYILTAYFPRFLRFVQRRMREVEAQREKFKKTHVVRGGQL